MSAKNGVYTMRAAVFYGFSQRDIAAIKKRFD